MRMGNERAIKTDTANAESTNGAATKGGTMAPNGHAAVRPAQAKDVHRLAKLSAKREGRHPVMVGLVIGALLATAAAFLIAQNTQNIGFDWLWISFDAALWAALLGSFLAGAIASPLVLLAVQAVGRRRRHFQELLERVGEEQRAQDPSDAGDPAARPDDLASRRRQPGTTPAEHHLP